jgi:hypothetical protein
MDSVKEKKAASAAGNASAGDTGVLVQPIVAYAPEPGHKPEDVLTVQQLIDLLREEEDYWTGEQTNTKLMITRLRKIFYDEWGWNSELIRGATDIEQRYVVEIVDDATVPTAEVRRFRKNEYVPKHRLVTYRDDDRVYGNTMVGQIPFIYTSDHQEVVLPDGSYCDIGHVLAGLDAFNYPQVVTPLPGYIRFLKYLGPHIDSNADVVTWLGDIASSSCDFLFDYIRNGKTTLTTAQEQHYIDIDAPGSDMLGNIDAYVIAGNYDIATSSGMRLTDILQDYYFGTNGNPPLRNRRYSIFCKMVGLTGWDGTNFANEEQWVKKDYYKQLRDNCCFQFVSLAEHNLEMIIRVFRIWFNGYRKVLKVEELLQIFVDALKENIKKEPSN